MHLVTWNAAMSLEILPFWQPKIFHGEGAITSDEFPCVWMDELVVQSPEYLHLDLLECNLEEYNLIRKRQNKSMNLENL